MSGRGVPVLGPGDEVRLGGQTYQVVALDGSSARLAGVTGAATVMLTGICWPIRASSWSPRAAGWRPR